MKLSVQEVLARWTQQVQDDLDGMHGWQSARLLETDSAAGGHLKVFFSSRLTDVVTQVRDVSALGFKIPGAIAREVKVCSCLGSYGWRLVHSKSQYAPP